MLCVVDVGRKHMLNQSLLKKHRILFIGIIVFSAGIAMAAVGRYFISFMNMCERIGGSAFHPGTVVVSTCPVMQDVGQDLTFTSYFYSTKGNIAGGETIQLPAHITITAPDGTVLYDTDFDDRLNISFRPQMYGNYTATITSLQEDYHPEYGQSTAIRYGFGFLYWYRGVYNPLGDAFALMASFYGVPTLIGRGVIIYGAVKAARKSKP